MHDPLVVAFEIRRPWPKRIGGDVYWPAMVTVWHREPGGRDSGEVCKHHVRTQNARGEWTSKANGWWRLHVHHWKIQMPPLQKLRRRLLTRCAWCGGKSRKGDSVNFSHSWDGLRSRWWQGERGLYHADCSYIFSAHGTCLCENPLTEQQGYGPCARCGHYRTFGRTEETLTRMRELAQIPEGARGTR